MANIQKIIDDSISNVYAPLEPISEGKCNIIETCLDELNKCKSNQDVLKFVKSLKNIDVHLIYREIYKVDLSCMSNVATAIINISIRSLLSKWDNSELYKQNIDNDLSTAECNKKNSENFLKFLKVNLDYILSIIDHNIQMCKDSKEDCDNVMMDLSCPYKKLKTVVFRNLHQKLQTVINGNTVMYTSNKIKDEYFITKDIINSPFIEISISIPNLIMNRQNLHNSTYKLIKFHSNKKPDFKELDMSVRFKILNGQHLSFPSEFLIDFLKQVKSNIRLDSTFLIKSKVDTLSVLGEFENDIKKCKHEVSLNTEYYNYLNQYPYIRYMGQSLEDKLDTVRLEYASQVSLDKKNDNYRLQETIYPISKFCINTFNMAYDIDKDGNRVFKIERQFTSELLSNGIKFKCVLCDFLTYGCESRMKMKHHLSSEHGEEPNWYCVKCCQEFPFKKLCNDRWYHKCVKKNK